MLHQKNPFTWNDLANVTNIVLGEVALNSTFATVEPQSSSKTVVIDWQVLRKHVTVVRAVSESLTVLTGDHSLAQRATQHTRFGRFLVRS